MEAIGRHYGPLMDKGLAMVASSDSDLAELTSDAVGYLKSTTQAVWTIELKPAEVRAHWSATAARSGSFPAWLRRVLKGPAWGTDLVPEDAALSVTAHADMTRALAEYDRFIAKLSKDSAPPRVVKALQQLRKVVKPAYDAMAGQMAVGLWGSAAGGIGFGGGSQLKPGHNYLETVRLVSRELNRLSRDVPALLRAMSQSKPMMQLFEPWIKALKGVEAALSLEGKCDAGGRRARAFMGDRCSYVQTAQTLAGQGVRVAI